MIKFEELILAVHTTLQCENANNPLYSPKC